jgi:hypothetical protein
MTERRREERKAVECKAEKQDPHTMMRGKKWGKTYRISQNTFKYMGYLSLENHHC